MSIRWLKFKVRNKKSQSVYFSENQLHPRYMLKYLCSAIVSVYHIIKRYVKYLRKSQGLDSFRRVQSDRQIEVLAKKYAQLKRE